MQNKTEVLNAIIQLASQKAFEPTPGNVAYLKVLQKLGMPHLESIIAYLEDELKKLQDMAKEQQQMAMQQQAQQQNNGGGQGQGQPQGAINPEELIAQLPPEQQQMFMQLMQENPQMAQQILQQAMGGGAA